MCQAKLAFPALLPDGTADTVDIPPPPPRPHLGNNEHGFAWRVVKDISGGSRSWWT
jgi:hypothetical protein